MTATQEGFWNLSPRMGYISEEKKGLGSITLNESILSVIASTCGYVVNLKKKKGLGKY